jgi:hypothetical protein
MPDKPLSKAAQAKALTRAMKRADRWFGKYIVLKEKKCIICKSEDNGQCSHYYGKRACPSVRYDEDNAHRMCSACHLRHHKIDNHVYDNWMRRHYSDKELDILESMAGLFNEVKETIEYYQGIEAKYKALVNTLLTKNGKV